MFLLLLLQGVAMCRYRGCEGMCCYRGCQFIVVTGGVNLLLYVFGTFEEQNKLIYKYDDDIMVRNSSFVYVYEEVNHTLTKTNTSR